MDLCDLLGVERPHPTSDQGYMFERPITFVHGSGSTSTGRIDCYKRGSFVLESKKLKASAATKRFDEALLRARSQGENYARALPAEEGRPPFVVVVDVGRVIELYAEFSRSGGTYAPFPDPANHRILIEDFRKPELLDRLRAIWTDPLSLDPARANARVTRTVATELAAVARSLEADGHASPAVAGFLTRCLFSMFAEDVGLLPTLENEDGAFAGLLRRHREDPATLRQMLVSLWRDMDVGGFSPALAKKVLRFNGKLFKNSDAEDYALPLKPEQIDRLLTAARCDWKEVEPSIFGTLLERALSPKDRHSLGAHYTPRAYVERLILPSLVEPLRQEWKDAQTAALLLAQEADGLEGKKKEDKMAEACTELRRFHQRLCTLRVLDPACGSGNFLYVALEHLKRLEGEVINQLHTFGDAQSSLGLEGQTVTLRQLLGIELNEQAAALAELVLWIGFLQWHIRTFGSADVAEPVVHDYGNIQNRDAVLDYEHREPELNAHGQPITRWDGETFKPHPVTGQPVPDEASQVVQWRYVNPRQAEWPKADFIVGNPPFIGNKRMREALGDGYADALRATWPEVPESADFVMYWWHKAAETVRQGQAERFGLITTNSLSMIFNRRVIEAHQAATPPLSLAFAVPDHPWVDSADGAAVRISMSVGIRGNSEGKLQTVRQEHEGDGGEVSVELMTRQGVIHADLKVGANVAGAKRLQANDRLSNRGVIPHGAGFTITPDEARSLGLGTVPGLEQHIRPYRNGRDLTGTPRGVLVIDLFGLQADEVRQHFPAVYQWLLERVKPERDQNPRPRRRDFWWRFAEDQPRMRESIEGLPRYIATVVTAKHRVFQFLDASVLADDAMLCIASDDPLKLGVLSSAVHVFWALATGSTLEDRPRYIKTTCFDAFPFPDLDPTGALAERIRSLADQIDAHRKTQLAAHPDATLTATYNVLEKLRSGETLSAKEKVIHEHGLVAVLKSLHDELDAAVLQAYGWSDLTMPDATDELLMRLVALNAERAAEELSGIVRWLRPDYQATEAAAPTQSDLDVDDDEPQIVATTTGAASAVQRPWPSGLAEQIKAVADAVARSPHPLSLDGIAEQFKSRGRWRDRLPVILDALETLGTIQSLPDGRWVA